MYREMRVRYKAEYKDELDRWRKTWDLGIRQDRMAALAALNEMTDRPSGTFSFDGPPDKPAVQGYFLVEWDDARPLAQRVLRPLYLRK